MAVWADVWVPCFTPQVCFAGIMLFHHCSYTVQGKKLIPAEPGLPGLSESFVHPREFEDGSFAL